MVGSNAHFGLVVAIMSFSIVSGMGCGEQDGQREEGANVPSAHLSQTRFPGLCEASASKLRPR